MAELIRKLNLFEQKKAVKLIFYATSDTYEDNLSLIEAFSELEEGNENEMENVKNYYINEIKLKHEYNYLEFMKMLLGYSHSNNIHHLMDSFNVNLSTKAISERKYDSSTFLSWDESRYVLNRMNSVDYVANIEKYSLHPFINTNAVFQRIAFEKDFSAITMFVKNDLLEDFLLFANQSSFHFSKYPHHLNFKAALIVKNAMKLCKLHDFSDLERYPELFVASKVGSINFQCGQIKNAFETPGNPAYLTSDIASSILENIVITINECKQVEHRKILCSFVCEKFSRSEGTKEYSNILLKRLDNILVHMDKSTISLKDSILPKVSPWYTCSSNIIFVNYLNFEASLKSFQSYFDKIDRIGMDAEWSGVNIATLQLAFSPLNQVLIFDMIELNSEQMEKFLKPLWESSKLFLGNFIYYICRVFDRPRFKENQ